MSNNNVKSQRRANRKKHGTTKPQKTTPIANTSRIQTYYNNSQKETRTMNTSTIMNNSRVMNNYNKTVETVKSLEDQGEIMEVLGNVAGGVQKGKTHSLIILAYLEGIIDNGNSPIEAVIEAEILQLAKLTVENYCQTLGDASDLLWELKDYKPLKAGIATHVEKLSPSFETTARHIATLVSHSKNPYRIERLFNYATTHFAEAAGENYSLDALCDLMNSFQRNKHTPSHINEILNTVYREALSGELSAV